MKRYYENGKLSDILSYKNNLLDGKCFSYDETGKVSREVEYREGELLR